MSTFLAFSVTIVATGVPQQLSYNPLQQGIGVVGISSSSNAIYIGNSAASAVAGGGGMFFGIGLGSASPLWFPIRNTNQIWISGTAGDVLNFFGS